MEKLSWKDLIPEDQFWTIIEQSLSDTTESKNQESFLRAKVAELSIEEVIGICYWNYHFLNKAIISKLWCAPYITMNGCGDDSFYYFRCWLLRRGKQAYDDALTHPDSLLKEFCKASHSMTDS